MTYLGLNALFLVPVVGVGVWALIVARTREGFRAASWYICLGVLLGMTALFDNIMIGIGLVGYDPKLNSGLFVGLAPLEDFAYALAAAILLPAIWVLLPRRQNVRD